MPLHTLRRLLFSSNPYLWLATGGLFVFGAACALGSAPAATAVLTTEALAIGSYWLWFIIGENLYAVLLNNIYDAEIDAQNPRKVAYEAVYDATLSWPYLSAMLFACLWYAVLLVLFPNPHLWVYGVALLLANIAYDIPPLRVKEWPLLDIVVGEVCMIAPIFAGYSLLAGAWPPLWAWGAAFVIFGAFELFHKVFDIEADRAMGVTTSATALGARASILTYLLLLAVTAALIFVGRHSFVETAAVLLYLPLPLLWLYSGTAVREKLYGYVRRGYVLGAGVVCSYMFGFALAQLLH